MFNKNKKGFSLAEVLVVVAIIGVIASVVLLSFNNTLVSSKERSAKLEVDELRTDSTLWFAEHVNYTDFCSSAAVAEKIKRIKKELYNDEDSDKLLCLSEGKTEENTGKNRWTLRLDFSENTDYCVDHTGFSGEKDWPTDTNGTKATSGDKFHTCE